MTSTDPGATTDAAAGQEALTRPEQLARDEHLAGAPKLLQTPSQTVGPFFGYALPYEGGPWLLPAGHPDAVRLHGTVFDGAGVPVPDALVELWEPDRDGRIVHEPGSRNRAVGRFTGFGRASVDVTGHFEFRCALPGPTGGARWALITVFARGLLHHLFTRVYFVPEGDAEPSDGLLAALPAERRRTLLALPDGPAGYRFDIRLQGEGETVFLDYPSPRRP